MNDGNSPGMSLPAANLTVAANAIQLGSEAVLKIAGTDIANTVGGSLVNKAAVQDLLAARLRSAIDQNSGEA